MTKATTETDRIAELEATITKRISEIEARHEERVDELSGKIVALETSCMVLLLATRVEDVGKRVGFTEQKETIQALLSMQRWPEDERRASKMLAVAQQTSDATFAWIEKMMAPLVEAHAVQLADQQKQEERDRQFEQDLEHGTIPVGFFDKLKAADRTHRARVGSFDDVRQGNALSRPRMNRF